jgi:hypothetical protein
MLAESSHVLAWATPRYSAKISLSRGAHCLATCSSRSMLLVKIADMLLGSDKSAGIGMLRNLKRVFTASAYPFTVVELSRR